MKRGGRRGDKPAKQARAARPVTANPRLTAQNRKILGKHYASKYRAR